MDKLLVKIIVGLAVIFSLILKGDICKVWARDFDLEKAEVAIEIDLPTLGESVSGPTQSFSEGTFSVEKVGYLKGNNVSVGVPEQFLNPADTAFQYGNVYLTVGSGDDYVIVVICKAEFTEGLPAMPEGSYEWDQLYVTDENGRKLYGTQSSSDVGTTRYYAQGTSLSREGGKKIKIHFFSTKDLGRN